VFIKFPVFPAGCEIVTPTIGKKPPIQLTTQPHPSGTATTFVALSRDFHSFEALDPFDLLDVGHGVKVIVERLERVEATEKNDQVSVRPNTIKSSRFAPSFRGISQMASAFIFFAMIQTCIYLFKSLVSTQGTKFNHQSAKHF